MSVRVFSPAGQVKRVPDSLATDPGVTFDRRVNGEPWKVVRFGVGAVPGHSGSMRPPPRLTVGETPAAAYDREENRPPGRSRARE